MIRLASPSVVCPFLLLMLGTPAAAQPPSRVAVDLTHYRANCGIAVKTHDTRVQISWPLDDSGGNDIGQVIFELAPGKPLIESVAVARTAQGPMGFLLREVDPVTFLTVGSRVAPPGRPPQISVWNVFFDKPANRPHRSYASQLSRTRARVQSEGKRATLAIGDLTIGPFSGELCFTFYRGARLMHVEAVVSTKEDGHAILYDAGLVGDESKTRRMAWRDADDRMRRAPPDSGIQRTAVDPGIVDRPLAVRHRAIVSETPHGSVVCFPPPHQYQFPRDWTDNLKFVWMGKNHLGFGHPFGFGIRQEPDGKRPYEPWFNAPPDTQQRLGVFYLLSRAKADIALGQTLRYTHGDQFPFMRGHITFTSHYHMAVAVSAMKGPAYRSTPPFINVFKEMGVNAVHLADFHGDGHQSDPGPFRLPELEALFQECRQRSDKDLLLIPGEECSDFLGIREPGKNPGHWMCLFPRPVYWVQRRTEGQPFTVKYPKYGTVYYVGNQRDMMELLKKEKGLAWTAHPRIKASSWTPDIFRREEFYLADYWLGAAWKAMPADLSRSRLGERALNLLDDMANWGQKKYLPGEVDVFKIDHTHELYGHMNINYLRLDRLPRFDDGWQPILDALRGGRFFTTTGEVLVHEFSVGGTESGGTLKLDADSKTELQVTLEWTFPLQFAEVISGDGKQVYRDRIPLANTGPFGKQTLVRALDLRGRKWVRFEVWDVAANGAYTQPVWLE